MLHPPRPRRQSPRLKAFDYTGTHIYNFGAVTRGRRPLFRDPVAARICICAIERACQKHAFEAIAFCVMPNHLHLLATSVAGNSAEEFLRYLKQIAGYEYKQRYRGHLWQISYYDHVLRVEEAIAPIAEYIWHNPVRAGIAGEARAYPFNGPRQAVLDQYG